MFLSEAVNNYGFLTGKICIDIFSSHVGLQKQFKMENFPVNFMENYLMP